MTEPASVVRTIFLNSRGLRAGWRLLIFIGLFIGLGFITEWIVQAIVRPEPRPFLDPLAILNNDLQGLVQALIATWIMGRIGKRNFRNYGIPSLRNAFGREFWAGIIWGFAAPTVMIGLIATFGWYRILGLAIHGRTLWYLLAIWLIANLILGISEEVQFRGYLLTTAADGIGFWAAAILLSVGFGALHYFFKPHERWEDFASTGLLGLFMCLTLRRTGSLAFAFGFHAASISPTSPYGRARMLVNTQLVICTTPAGKARSGLPEECLVRRRAGWCFL